MKIKANLLLLIVLSLAIACTPARKARKYDYLVKERPAESSEPARAPEVRNPRPTAPAKKPKAERNSPSNISAETATVVQTAKSYIGTPYRYGGLSKSGMDCSGLIYTSYQSIDFQVPRTSGGLAEMGRKINRDKLQPGDLVFFNAKGGGNKIDHVGMVVSVSGGEVEFIHATTSRGVRTDLLNSGYWDPRFRKAVRIR